MKIQQIVNTTKVVKRGEVESSFPMGGASSRLANWNKEPPQLNKDQTSY